MEQLELKLNNLYANGYIVDFPKEGENALYRELLTIEKDVDDNYHTVVDGDRLDLLAYTYYRFHTNDASKFWWVIADANLIFNPFDLSDLVGKEIIIPNIERILLML